MMTSRKQRSNRIRAGVFLLLFVILGFWLWNRYWSQPRQANVVVYADALERTRAHYGNEVEIFAAEFGLPSSYLLALIVLESSGRRIIPPRFEPHVYERLKEVQQGKRSSYEHVTPAHLADATDDALKNLASSWGPFQLMGYKCLLLGIRVRDIRGNDAIYWGIKWIDMTYGKELKEGNFKDAFHMHNTGRKYPRIGKPFTHDPAYVERGLKYMQSFENTQRAPATAETR
ncbi:MAG: hypothetical protein R6V49_07715 [Bacteroidales bacterium]